MTTIQADHQNVADNICVQIFAKSPIAGQVKTRLARDIGEEKAALFAQLQLEDMLQRFIDQYPLQCWIAGDLQHPFFATWQQTSVAFCTQHGVDLGARMQFAMRCALADYDAAIIIGSDCQSISSMHVERVIALLEQFSMVFVPACDGGFVLWASKIDVPELFNGVSWGGDQVWQQTILRLEEQQIDYACLEPAWDIDTLDDIRQHRARLSKKFHTFLQKHDLLS